MGIAVIVMFIFLLFYQQVLSIYLPTTEKSSVAQIDKSKLTFELSGPKMVKLNPNASPVWALTTVLIMGSAGMTVVCILCVFIVCMRNEEHQINETFNIQGNQRRHHRRSTNSQLELEPLVVQYYSN